MADSQNFSQEMGAFSIENTMEMGGVGDTELIKGLFGAETSTASPDDVTEIKEEAPAKEAVPKKDAAPKEEEKSDSIQEFLMKGDPEDEEEEHSPKSKAAPKEEQAAPPAEDEEPEEQGTQFSALAKDLMKLGVFTSDEEEEEIPINTAEEFLERFQVEKKKGAIDIVNQFIGQFGQDYQDAFDAIFVKGVDPKDYFGTYNNIQSFSEMDLSQESNQVAVLKQALTDQGFETEDIDTEIERLRNYGDLETVATKHHKVLVKKEAQKLQQMEEQRELQLKQQAAVKQQYVNNVSTVLQEKLKAKEFDGIPINPKLAGELQDFLLTDKYKLPSGELLTEFDRTILDLKRPENHEMKVKVALLLKVLEKDPTLSTIQKTGITKKSNELFGEVARQASKSSAKSSNKSSANPNSWFL
jgi:hypothetical protein